ncbi:hypothetical protein IKG68_02210 [Candidatus Saccharibacteria bacterium]|nr:hypothetical protein [Candidatus Saccharibacteria bacterium]
MVKQRLASAVMALVLMCGVGLPLVAPVATYATGDMSGVSTDAVTVGTAEELASALANGAANIILTADIETEVGFEINSGTIIDGNGHTINATSDSENVFNVTTSEVVKISRMIINTNYRAIAIDDVAANVEIDGVIMTAKKRGVSVYNGLNEEGYLGIKNSIIQQEKTELAAHSGNAGDDYNTAASSDGGLGDYRGVSLYEVIGAKVEIVDTLIQGFWTAININGANYDSTGTVIDVVDSVLKGRSGINLWSDNLTININRSTIHGINNWAGPTERFSNIVLNRDANRSVNGAKINIVDTEFTNYLNDTGLDGESAAQYMMGIRAYSEDNPNVISISGNTTFVDYTKSVGRSKMNTVFEPFCQDSEIGVLPCPEVNITGGTFDYYEDIKNYFIAMETTDYEIYARSDDGPYTVDKATTVELPEVIYVAKGKTRDLAEGLSEIAQKYGTLGIMDAEVASLDGYILSGEKTGETILNFNLHNLVGEPIEKNVKVVVYEVTPAADDESETEEEADTITEYVTDQIAAIMDGDESAAKKVVLTEEPVEIGGESYTGVELVEAVLSNGYEIETVLLSDALDADLWAEADAIDEIVETMADDEGLAALFDGNILMYAVKDGEDPVYLGEIIELDEPVTITVTIPEEYLDVPTGYERTFKIVRGHIAADGTKTADYLEVARDGDKLTFKTDKFSTFAITYADVLVGGESADVSPVTPETGALTTAAKIDTMGTSGSKTDTSGLVFAVAILTIATVVMEVALWKRQRGHKN